MAVTLLTLTKLQMKMILYKPVEQCISILYTVILLGAIIISSV